MFKADYWIFSTLFCIGVIGGLSFLLITAAPEDQSAHRPTAENASISASNRFSSTNSIDQPDRFTDATVQKLSRLRQEGDQFLLAGNFNAAGERFRTVQRIQGRLTSEICLRLAICAEFRGNPVAATDQYERVIELKPKTSQKWLAISGLTRCWMARDNQTEALRTLGGLLLESLGPSRIPEEVRAQIAYQLGNVYMGFALQDYHFDLSLPSGVCFQQTGPEVSELLAILNNPERATEPVSEPVEQSSGSTEPVITILQRPTNSLNLMIVNAQSPVKPVALLTRHLAAACGLELLASPRAQIAIQSRAKSLNVNNAPASLLLDSLLLPLDLYWVQTADRIHITSFEESDSTSLEQKTWMEAAERAFRNFNLAFPGDPRHHSALLARANLSFIAGDLDTADHRYQELINSNPKDEMLARLFFNLGKIKMRLGRNGEAIQFFFQAVDQSYDAALQSSGYWLAGQLSLETGNLDEAIKTAGRALSTAHSENQKRLAAMTMARAFLLNNQPAAANQVLFEHHGFFAGSKLNATASILSSYARLVGIEDRNSLKTESQRLLTALSLVPDEDYENFLDIYIAARAFEKLGFQQQAIEKLTRAIESTTINHWRRRFLFELAVQEKIAGKYEQAASVFEFLIDDDIVDQWRQNSMLYLALIYVELNRSQDCIDLCEQLWAIELNEDEKIATLNAMGKAYRDLGQDHSAALCFAGMLPRKRVD